LEKRSQVRAIEEQEKSKRKMQREMEEELKKKEDLRRQMEEEYQSMAQTEKMMMEKGDKDENEEEEAKRRKAEKEEKEQMKRKKILEQADELEFHECYLRCLEAPATQAQLMDLELDVLTAIGRFRRRAEMVVMRYIDKLPFSQDPIFE
jgi:hypothetical protein